MNAAPPVTLSPDQAHGFRTAGSWSDFRALFPSMEAALDAHVIGATELAGSSVPSHELHWRMIYHDRASARRQLFALPLLLLGHISTHHAEYHFVTRHAFSAEEARRLFIGRALASLAYHACFLGTVLCGVGAFVVAFMLAMPNSGMKQVVLLIVALVACASLFVAARRTRSLGLPASLRPIAKDAFDLVSIKRLKPK